MPMNFLVGSAVAVFLLDQASKSLIQLRLENRTLSLGSIVTLRHLASTRGHYRVASARAAMIVIWAAAFVAAALLSSTSGPTSSPSVQVAMGAALGGAAGNLSDVLRMRSVRDFIDLGWWPVFNLADVAIVAGIIGLLIGR
ncbi:MAG TPA: signal peptidase II [Gemmatimonadaceae bacterium]